MDRKFVVSIIVFVFFQLCVTATQALASKKQLSKEFEITMLRGLRGGDDVSAERRANTLVVNVAKRTGISEIEIRPPASGWSRHLSVIFHSFGMLESFGISNGTLSLTSSLKESPQTMLTTGPSSNRTSSLSTKYALQINKVNGDGDILVKVPDKFLRIGKSKITISWIDAYR